MENLELINSLIDKLVLSDISVEELNRLEQYYQDEKYKDYISSRIELVGGVKSELDEEFKKKLNIYHSEIDKNPSVIPLMLKISSIAAVFFLVTFFIINRYDKKPEEIALNDELPDNIKNSNREVNFNRYRPEKSKIKTNYSKSKTKIDTGKGLATSAPIINGSDQKRQLTIRYKKSRNSKIYYTFNGTELILYTPDKQKLEIINLSINKNKYFLNIDGKSIEIVKTKYKKELKLNK